MKTVGEKAKITNGTYNWSSTKENPFRDLSHHRIYCVLEGGASILTPKGRVELSAGNSYYFPSNSIISTQCADKMKHYYLHFTLNNPANYLEHFDYPTSIVTNDLTVKMLDLIIDHMSSYSVNSYLKCDGALQIIFSYFFENVKEIDSGILRFGEVLNYIDENLNKNISMTELANLVDLSPVYFSYLFKKTFNITPLVYISQKKLVLAKRLLINTVLPIKEVAKRCGFQDPYYFSNWFCKNTTMYPESFKSRTHH